VLIAKTKTIKKQERENERMLIRGKAKWAKIIGEPSWGYENKFKEWSIDVYVDAETQERLKAEGLGEKLKDKGNGVYITFKRKELKTDGSPNQPIRIVDHRGNDWDSRKIGNGSTVNVNFAINEFKPKQFAANILSLQVWDYVAFDGGEFPTRDDSDTGGGDDWAAEVADEPKGKKAAA